MSFVRAPLARDRGGVAIAVAVAVALAVVAGLTLAPAPLAHRRSAALAAPAADTVAAGTPALPLAPTARPRVAPGTSVLVVGDSLTVGAVNRGGLRRRLLDAGFAAVTVDAAIGRTARQGLDVLRNLPAIPDVVVIALGTNDAAAGVRVSSVIGTVERALALVAPRPLVWVDVALDTSPPAITRAAELTRTLHATAGRIPGLWIAPWAEAAVEHERWWADDGVHLTRAGERARAALIADVATEVAPKAGRDRRPGGTATTPPGSAPAVATLPPAVATLAAAMRPALAAPARH
jgi:lysophospholipase L1-like esterase